MPFILLFILSFCFSNPSVANELSLDLRHEKIMQILGPLDGQYSVPSQVLAYIQGSEDLESNRGQALLQLAQDYTTAIEDLSDARLARVDARQILKSEFCVRFQFGGDARRKNAKIHSLIFNHYENARLGIRLNTHLANVLPYLPEESTWAEECRFPTKILHSASR
jgi:hypothetical protein